VNGRPVQAVTVRLDLDAFTPKGGPVTPEQQGRGTMDSQGNGQSASLIVHAESKSSTRAEAGQSGDRVSQGDSKSGQPPGKQPMRPTESGTGNGRAQEKTSRTPRPGRRLFDLHEAADYLGCCEKTVRDLILDGVIPQVKLTSRIQIDILDLDELIESRKKVYLYPD
jgi:excisionase family DNA binding protein